ncbi:MAG: hypothetical protein Q7W51_01750 [Coriobacteriia bacterium]|nr:hypothetical protein [Coriobacteriia bacterium]
MDLFAGKMTLYALLSAFAAAPLTVGLLSLFRRSVVRGMKVDTGATHGDRPGAADSSAGRSRLTLRSSDAAQLAALGVYSAAGVTFAPFALRRRSELLFDYLSRVWLHVGAVHMIAGPDLVTATVSPPEFLVFLSGRMSRRFIHDSIDLGAYLSGLDLAPDPDGRYRVNQLFCRDNVWRDAMRGLAGVSAAVLMDLRGFTPANRGCAYEIGELLQGVPLGRVVFAVDGTTDRLFLDALFEEIRTGLPVESPNAWPGSIASRIVSVDDSVEGRRRLLRVLADSVPA